MKILLDCVVTSSDPSKCSSNIQYITFVERTLKEFDNVFFYWLIPDWVTDELLQKSYPQSERILYHRIPQHKDRTKEYLTISKELDEAVAFNGIFWDYDVLITMRSGLAAIFRMLATSPRGHASYWVREVWVLEMMTLMTFKKTVLKFGGRVQDRFTLDGYMAAAKVFVLSQSDRAGILSAATELLPPSSVRELDTKLVTAGYAQFSDLELKGNESFPDPMRGKPLCLAHAGRMEKANAIDLINDVMVKQFIMKGVGIKLLVCTVSSIIKAFDTTLIDVVAAGRDEFWKICRQDMHLIINMSEEGGSALSLLEPMMLGVPAIVGPRKSMEGIFGPDYPFMANNMTEAYALVTMFYEDYAAMYEIWADWHKHKFGKIVKERLSDKSVYSLLRSEVIRTLGMPKMYAARKASKKNNKFVKDLMSEDVLGGGVVIPDVIRKLVAKGTMGVVMAQKIEAKDRDYRGLIWSTDFNDSRLIMKAFFGYDDASSTVGHLRKV